MSHSEIPGSKVICTYPRLIAAYHVLHRLREPRHPPDALTCFRRLLLFSVQSPVSSVTLYTHHSTLYKNIAHTFSCNQLLRFSFTYFYAELSFLLTKVNLLTVLCHNMSKISSCLEVSLMGYADQHSHRMVENNGFEPLTPCLQSRCSSQLS